MEWSPYLTAGVDIIDYQHKELIDRVNNFFSAIKGNNKEHEILKIFSFLEQYVIIHFRDEERLQVDNDYPFYLEHKAMHKQFTSDINEIKHRFQSKGFNFASSLVVSETLSNWLITHIGKEDKKLGEYINSL